MPPARVAAFALDAEVEARRGWLGSHRLVEQAPVSTGGAGSVGHHKILRDIILHPGWILDVFGRDGAVLLAHINRDRDAVAQALGVWGFDGLRDGLARDSRG